MRYVLITLLLAVALMPAAAGQTMVHWGVNPVTEDTSEVVVQIRSLAADHDGYVVVITTDSRKVTQFIKRNESPSLPPGFWVTRVVLPVAAGTKVSRVEVTPVATRLTEAVSCDDEVSPACLSRR